MKGSYVQRRTPVLLESWAGNTVVFFFFGFFVLMIFCHYISIFNYGEGFFVVILLGFLLFNPTKAWVSLEYD